MQPITEINNMDDDLLQRKAAAEPKSPRCPRPTLRRASPPAKARPHPIDPTHRPSSIERKNSVLASYRLGLAIVATVILGSAAFNVAVVGSVPKSYPAGEDLGDGIRPSVRSGSPNGRDGVSPRRDLADDVWIASFVFTRCPLSRARS